MGCLSSKEDAYEKSTVVKPPSKEESYVKVDQQIFHVYVDQDDEEDFIEVKISKSSKLINLVQAIQTKRRIGDIERVKLCFLDEDNEILFDGKEKDIYGNPDLHTVFVLSDDVIKLGLYNIYASKHPVLIKNTCSNTNSNHGNDCEEDECLQYIIVGTKHSFKDHPIPTNGASIPMKQAGGFFTKSKDKYYKIHVIKQKLSQREEGKIVTECYKIPCFGLKEILINAKGKTISPKSDPAQNDIPMVPTTDQGIQKIFFDKDNQCAWDRWGKDVAKLVADFGGKVVGEVAGVAVGAAI